MKLGLSLPMFTADVGRPLAAASYLASVLGRDVPAGSSVVVYDLGAGTFDASVVTATADGFVVAAVDGRETGGLRLDDVLTTLLDACHTLALELQPFLPAAATRLSRALAEKDPEFGRRLFEKAPPGPG